MTLTTIIAYCGALFIAAAIPGPGMTAIVARALVRFPADLLHGAWAHPWRSRLSDRRDPRAGGAGQDIRHAVPDPEIPRRAYLVYVAWKLWTAGLVPQDIKAEKAMRPSMSFLSGLLVTLGNPKTMLFYVALVPTLIPLEAVGLADYILLVGLTFIVLMSVLLPYILLAAQARGLLKRPEALKILNRSAAGILAGTAAYIAARAS